MLSAVVGAVVGAVVAAALGAVEAPLLEQAAKAMVANSASAPMRRGVVIITRRFLLVTAVWGRGRAFGHTYPWMWRGKRCGRSSTGLSSPVSDC